MREITYRPLIPFKRVKPFPPPKSYTLEILQYRLKVLKDHGFLEVYGTSRSAAIGESLELYIGKEKDSSRVADWGEYELKTNSRGKSHPISLFSVKWNFLNDYSEKKVLMEFGKMHHSKHKDSSAIRLDWSIKHSVDPLNNLYINISRSDADLNLYFEKRLIATVKNSDLKNWFEKKLKNLIVIGVKSLKVGNKQGFVIKNAYLFENSYFLKFINLVKLNNIKLNFRLRVFNPNTPNEDFKGGSAFRATQIYLNRIYKNNTKII